MDLLAETEWNFESEKLSENELLACHVFVSGPPLLITSHNLLRSFVKFQLIAHLLHGGSKSFNLFLLLQSGRLLSRNLLLLLCNGRL